MAKMLINVADDMLGRWKADAKARGITLTALVIERMETPPEPTMAVGKPLPDGPSFSHGRGRVVSAGDDLTQRLEQHKRSGSVTRSTRSRVAVAKASALLPGEVSPGKRKTIGQALSEEFQQLQRGEAPAKQGSIADLPSVKKLPVFFG